MSERDMQKLLDLVEKHLGGQWLDVVDFLRQTNDLESIEAAIRTGDFSAVVQAVQDAALKFAAETHASYVHSAQQAAQWLDDQPALADTLVRFDQTNPEVIAAARANQLEWVSGLTSEARETINQVLVRGAQASTNPLEMARDIRDSLGLTPQQEQAVASYRNALESQDYGNALGRELSSGHSDRTIAAARNADRAMAQPAIDTAVERYRQNMVTARAEGIAQTEAGKNVHAGVTAAFEQAIARGDIDADQLEKEWLHSGNALHARPTHVAADGTKVAFRDTFDIGGVRMRFPHDPSAPVKEIMKCACTVAHTLKAA